VPFEFIADDHDISRPPLWVKSGRQTSDGHLAELAKAHDSALATLDERIPSAFVIPA
jgi:predicted nucleic acid-binding protein